MARKYMKLRKRQKKFKYKFVVYVCIVYLSFSYTFYYSLKHTKRISNEEFIGLNFVSDLNLENIKDGDVLIANDKQGLFLKAKDAVIEAIEIQVEGSKKMNAKDYLRGDKL